FRYNGTFIQDNQKIAWYKGYLKKTMTEIPGLYDDIYMDLTFVDILDRVGLNAPVDSFANAFANAEYLLWHANQAARYNILNGIKAPESGHWKNNPHADDIDYQIEADFAGLMSPGMPNEASAISDKVGHIMNYGDGWYGGVYVGAMYSLAFISSDINFVVTEALKTIPQKSQFYQCINDVIKWHKLYPSDWKRTWFEIQRKWSAETGCPDGIFMPFNIDAKVNAAYVVLGLLYGQGDFTKTLEVATRAGQDSDCNPSSAGGILGALMGYDKIPAYWKQGLDEIEDMDFRYTTMSLNKVYDISYKHALEMIKKNGGSVENEKITIKIQKPSTVKFEQCFEGMIPVETAPLTKTKADEFEFEFNGTGFVVRGEAIKKENDTDTIIEAQLYVDDKPMEKALLPTSFIKRRHELFWKYDLPEGKHKVRIVGKIKPWNYIYYSPTR
ncbi:MAG: ADP-ribosylglycohydrolase family protein, partial [Chitinophagaceae bacterium]